MFFAENFPAKKVTFGLWTFFGRFSRKFPSTSRVIDLINEFLQFRKSLNSNFFVLLLVIGHKRRRGIFEGLLLQDGGRAS